VGVRESNATKAATHAIQKEASIIGGDEGLEMKMTSE